MNESWWVAGVSIQGTQKAAAGLACEDAHFTAESEEGFVLVACDGQSKAPFARDGAAIVARGVGELLLKNAPEVMARSLRGDAVMEVILSLLEKERARQGKGVALADYACTLVALLVHGAQAMTCHIGDGCIFMLEGEFARCISPPDRDPSGGSLTRFVTCKGTAPRMWLYPVHEYATGFLVVTDGAQPGLYNAITGSSSGLVARLLNKFDLSSTREERESDLGVQSASALQRLSDDDITVIGARRAYVAGIWGCPECKSLSVEPRITAVKMRFFGYCRNCGHQVFLWPNTQDVQAAYRHNWQRVRKEELTNMLQVGRIAKGARRLHTASATHHAAAHQ